MQNCTFVHHAYGMRSFSVYCLMWCVGLLHAIHMVSLFRLQSEMCVFLWCNNLAIIMALAAQYKPKADFTSVRTGAICFRVPELPLGESNWSYNGEELIPTVTEESQHSWASLSELPERLLCFSSFSMPSSPSSLPSLLTSNLLLLSPLPPCVKNMLCSADSDVLWCCSTVSLFV